MEDKIFIKEQEVQGGNSMGKFILISIVLLVIVAGAALFLVLGSDSDKKSSDNGSDDKKTESQPVTDNDDTDTADQPKDSDDNVDDIDDTTDDTDTDDADDTDTTDDKTDFAAPTDPKKINLYFPDANGEFGPSLRDKPETGLNTYTIAEILKGPNATEKSAGYKSTWAFSGTSACTTNVTFKYETSGTTLKVTMCRPFTGSNIDKFIEALNLSITEQGTIKKVAVIDNDGKCLGSNKSCL